MYKFPHTRYSLCLVLRESFVYWFISHIQGELGIFSASYLAAGKLCIISASYLAAGNLGIISTPCLAAGKLDIISAPYLAAGKLGIISAPYLAAVKLGIISAPYLAARKVCIISTFQQHLHMKYISLRWYDIPELVIPIKRVAANNEATELLYVCFVDRCLSFCTFSFGHCVVCSSSIYRFWLPLWYLQTLLHPLTSQRRNYV